LGGANAGYVLFAGVIERKRFQMTQDTNFPPASPPPMGPDAESQVKGPAIFLMVAGGLVILGQILSLLLQLLGIGLGAMGGQGGMGAMLSGGLGIMLGLFNMVLGAVVVFGGFKMMKMQSYGLAMAAAIIAMLPCSFCCLVSLPAGIWALIVLMKPEVKAAFGQGGGGFPTT
jgi:hypothetical protein